MLDFFIEHYLVAMLASLAFVIFICCDHTTSKAESHGFLYSALCICVLILAEIAENYYASLLEPCTMRILVSAIAYSARPAIIYFILREPIRKISKRASIAFAIPLILDVVVSFSALISPLAFSYSAGNHFSRGPLGFISFVVAAFYFIALLVMSFLRMRRGEVVEIVICSTAIVVCSIGIYCEYEYSHVGILPAVAIFSELFYFMYLIMTRYSTDYLTGAYMRSHMYKEIEGRKCDRFYIIFDVNGLKQINDTFGHKAGDEALVTFADAVRASMPRTAMFYRLGGDEFAIVYRTSHEENVKSLIDAIKEHCGDSKSLTYGFSYGYTHFVDASEFEKASAAADGMLYETKRAFWETHDRRTAAR